MEQKVCFVVMGFGQKTDFELGKTYDLNATYNAIIKPAVEKAGLKCIRADEILHSGMIDTKMYKMLYQADLVIADITTGNVNAVYELGVRHALKPRSTIIMMEKNGRFAFDLNHISTFQYEHLGKDIAFSEVNRATSDLINLIKSSLEDQEDTDSPVYTYLSNLQMPLMSEEEFSKEVEKIEQVTESLHQLLLSGQQCLDREDFISAASILSAANDMYKAAKSKASNSPIANVVGDPGVVQKLVLATYKSEMPSKHEALLKALEIAKELQPYESNDPETCGLTGSIHKRLWDINKQGKDLELAIKQYGRGFEVSRDYYNGENFATCLDFAADSSDNPNEIIYNRMRANKARHQIIENLEKLVFCDDTISERSDRLWIFATLANCHLAIGNQKDADLFEKRFHDEQPANWQIATFNEGKSASKQAFEKWQQLGGTL